MARGVENKRRRVHDTDETVINCQQYHEDISIAKRFKSKRCEHEGCGVLPIFNVEGESRGRFCKTHKLAGMVDIKHKRCEHEGCVSYPSFNVEGESRGRFCKTHKLVGMVDVHNRNKRCEHEGCVSRPIFNVEGESRGRFCKTHKQADMVDIQNKRCEHEGCGVLPSFNVEGESRGRFCKTHKQPGMVDIKHKRCEHEGCVSHPSFNVDGESRGRFCKTHKLADMVDIQHKRCEHEGCDTRPSYGLPGFAASFCKVHHPAGTMKCSNRKCHCRETATHGITQPERCEQHALRGDDNLVERECSSCVLPCVLNDRGVCVDCEAYLSGKTPRLAKQREVLQFLDHQFAEFPYDLTDRTPPGLKDCDRRERPDVLWDRTDRIVILEIDEEQHKDRPCECEQTRMMNISQALGCEKTVWIRYNPDAFKSPESRKWSKRHKRHEVLKEWLSWALLSDELPYTISVVHLFFDTFREGSVQIEKFL